MLLLMHLLYVVLLKSCFFKFYKGGEDYKCNSRIIKVMKLRLKITEIVFGSIKQLLHFTI